MIARRWWNACHKWVQFMYSWKKQQSCPFSASSLPLSIHFRTAWSNSFRLWMKVSEIASNAWSRCSIFVCWNFFTVTPKTDNFRSLLWIQTTDEALYAVFMLCMSNTSLLLEFLLHEMQKSSTAIPKVFQCMQKCDAFIMTLFHLLSSYQEPLPTDTLLRQYPVQKSQFTRPLHRTCWKFLVQLVHLLQFFRRQQLLIKHSILTIFPHHLSIVVQQFIEYIAISGLISLIFLCMVVFLLLLPSKLSIIMFRAFSVKLLPFRLAWCTLHRSYLSKQRKLEPDGSISALDTGLSLAPFFVPRYFQP